MRRDALARPGVVVVAALLCVGACGPGGDDATVGMGTELLPSSSTADWVTYGDVAVRARAVEVVEVPPSSEEVQAGEGIVGRRVTLGVQDVLWEQPGRTVDVPRTVVVDAGGWTFHGKSRKRLEVSGAPELLVGHEYLLVLANTRMTTDGSPAWMPIGHGAMLPFDDAIVGRGEDVNGNGPGARAAWGMTASQVKALLAKSPPHPEARSAMTLDALSRLAAVQATSQ